MCDSGVGSRWCARVRGRPTDTNHYMHYRVYRRRIYDGTNSTHSIHISVRMYTKPLSLAAILSAREKARGLSLVALSEHLPCGKVVFPWVKTLVSMVDFGEGVRHEFFSKWARDILPSTFILWTFLERSLKASLDSRAGDMHAMCVPAKLIRSRANEFYRARCDYVYPPKRAIADYLAVFREFR